MLLLLQAVLLAPRPQYLRPGVGALAPQQQQDGGGDARRHNETEFISNKGAQQERDEGRDEAPKSERDEDVDEAPETERDDGRDEASKVNHWKRDDERREQATAALAKDLQAQAAAAREKASKTLLERSVIVCAPDNTETAIIIAADIRMDPVIEDRGGQVSRMTAFTQGSNLFVHTDYAFANDVNMYFPQAVAVRYTEEEDGGVPETFAAGIGVAGGTMIQWWRLQKAWTLLTDYEDECTHEYDFVMKMRTDARLMEVPRPLANLYESVIKPDFGTKKVAFLSSDRFFGGSHATFEQLAQFGTKWLTDYDDDLGVTGSCDDFGHAFAVAETTPKLYEVGLNTDLDSFTRKGCKTVSLPQNCSEACVPAELTEDTISACPVHESDLTYFEGANVTLASHSFGHGGAVVDLDEDELEAARLNPVTGEAWAGLACMMRGSSRRKGGSEMMFTYHAFISNLAIRSFTELDDTIWNRNGHALEDWRHVIRLWSDGFTVDDGPLQSYEVTANAHFAARLKLDTVSCVMTSWLEGVADAAFQEVQTGAVADADEADEAKREAGEKDAEMTNEEAAEKALSDKADAARDAERDAERDADRDAERDAKRDAERDAERDDERDAKRDAKRDAERDDERDAERDAERDEERDAERDAEEQADEATRKGSLSRRHERRRANRAQDVDPDADVLDPHWIHPEHVYTWVDSLEGTGDSIYDWYPDVSGVDSECIYTVDERHTPYQSVLIPAKGDISLPMPNIGSIGSRRKSGRKAS